VNGGLEAKKGKFGGSSKCAALVKHTKVFLLSGSLICVIAKGRRMRLIEMKTSYVPNRLLHYSNKSSYDSGKKV
jgi:hypothetical protein